MNTQQKETELEEETELEGEEDNSSVPNMTKPFDPLKIEIAVEPKTLDLLIKRIRYGEIDMNTDFQRHPDLWDNQKMSRLIESILIRFPLPAFYFDASDENNWLIVDGLQRLSAIKKFVIDGQLRLSGLEFLTHFEGKIYKELPRHYQRRIEECQVTAYMIKPGTPVDVKYSVFRRINTGGLTLNTQEIRNAMAKPRERELLEELANHEKSKRMLGDFSKRMKDQELVLRFWAFYQFDYLDPKNKRKYVSFFDKAMEDIKQGDEKHIMMLREAYFIAITRCYELLGTTAFEREPERRIKNSTLFEVLMVTMAKLSEIEFEMLKSKDELFKSKFKNLLSSHEFKSAITYSTQNRDHVETRYSKLKELIEEVLND